MMSTRTGSVDHSHLGDRPKRLRNRIVSIGLAVTILLEALGTDNFPTIILLHLLDAVRDHVSVLFTKRAL